MNFEEYAQRVENDLRTWYPTAEIVRREVEKLNEEPYLGISVIAEGQVVGPTVNLNKSFMDMEVNGSYDTVFGKMIDMVDEGISRSQTFDVRGLTDYNAMKEKIGLEAIPLEANRELLVDIPHEKIEDIAIVYRFYLEQGESGTSSVLITNSMLENYGVSEEQFKADAAANAPVNNPPTIRSMAEVLRELTGGMMEMPEEEAPMWVASVESGINGAGVLGYPGFMEMAAEKMGGDFYLLPSSIHELLVIPDNGEMSAKVLDEMVQGVNATELSAKERLADHAYHYDSKEKIFEIATAYEDRMSQREQELKTLEHFQEDEEHGEKAVVIDALMVEAGRFPRPVKLATELEDLQEAVGGLIEYSYQDDGQTALLINEEGKINGLPLNRALRDEDGNMYDIVAGTFFVVGMGAEDLVSLTPEQMAANEEKFHQPEAFVKMGRTMMAIPIPDSIVKAQERDAGSDRDQRAKEKLLKKHEDQEH